MLIISYDSQKINRVQTNISKHGGDFKAILNREFKQANSVTIASGYAGLDILYKYKNDFIRIASKGGRSKLLLGMAFYEGLSQAKLTLLNDLNTALSKYKNGSGVYVAHGRRYHGKVYLFESDKNKNIYVGSSNFSSSGIAGNIECTIPILNGTQKASLVSFINDLFSKQYSLQIDRARISIPSKRKIVTATLENRWKNLQKHDPSIINLSQYPNFKFPLSRIVEKEKSNLNVYFGKGRLNKKTGKILPRPWYEIELIADKKITSNALYPKGDFLGYTDDGIVLPMRTQGDYYKNIRSRSSLQLFGMWLKGKLEKQGALNKYEPVTLDTLQEYGKDEITLYKIDKGKYYMEY